MTRGIRYHLITVIFDRQDRKLATVYPCDVDIESRLSRLRFQLHMRNGLALSRSKRLS